MPGDSGWNEYEKLVMAKLQSLEDGQKATQEVVRTIEKEIVLLKAKSAVWGLLAGAIAGGVPAMVAFVMWLVSR